MRRRLIDCGRIKRLPVKKTKITEPVEARCVLLVLCLPPLCILCSLTWSEKRVLWMGTNKNLACLIRSASVFLFTYSDTLLQLKLFLVWIGVVLLDSFTNFRFEYLYPMVMFLRSVYESYKYQGLVCRQSR